MTETELWIVCSILFFGQLGLLAFCLSFEKIHEFLQRHGF
jgi:hypothetical protein